MGQMLSDEQLKPEALEKGKDAGKEKEPEGSLPKVFNKIWQTSTFHTPDFQEGKDPVFGLLMAKDIASDGAITAVLPGNQQTVINGDSILHLTGNRSERIDKDESLEIIGTQAHVMHESAQLSYEKSRLIAVKEFDLQRIHGGRDVVVIGETNELYMAKREVSAPEDFEWKQFDRSYNTTKFDWTNAATEITMVLVEFTGVDLSLKGVSPFGEKTLWDRFFGEGKGEGEVEGAEVVEEAAPVVEEAAAVGTEVAEGAVVVGEVAEGAAAVVGAVALAPELLVGAAVLGTFALAAWGVTKMFGDKPAAPAGESASAGSSGGSDGNLGEGGSFGGGGTSGNF